MKSFYKLVLFMALSLFSVKGLAQFTFKADLYPEGEPDVVMDIYIPAEFTTGKYILVCPGGGYRALSKISEGSMTAQWLNANGIAAAVLHYRLPEGNYEIPLQDALRAMEKLREIASDRVTGKGSAAEQGINPNMRPSGVQAQRAKVGIMGFSAGGHLASTVLTQFTNNNNRPDFGILFYPVITMDPSFTHLGSRKNLIGENASDELTRHFSSELNVQSDTPPTFIISTADDTVVPVKNTMVFYQALTDKDVPAELHIYPDGGHGWGFQGKFSYRENLYRELLRWIGDR